MAFLRLTVLAVAAVCLLGSVSAEEEGSVDGQEILAVMGDFLKKHVSSHTGISVKSKATMRVLDAEGAPLAELDTEPQPGNLTAATFQAFQGQYISGCADISDQVHGGPYPFSVFAIREFLGAHAGNSWDLEITWYFSDATCKPNASETVARFQIHGNITYKGENEAIGLRGSYRVIYQVISGTYIFPTNKYQQAILDGLTEQCPCGLGQWKGGAVGNHVVATSCDSKAIIDNATAHSFCRTVAGEQLFGNVRYTDRTQTDYYISNSEFNNQRGWTNPVNSSYFIEKLKESGNNDPDNCEFDNLSLCGPAIIDASNICTTCETELECAGCVFRELPDDDAGEYGWTKCCPCIHYLGQKRSIKFLEGLYC